VSGTLPNSGAEERQTAAPIVEIVSAGNEVLIGDVLYTNTNWLCVKVTGLGGLVRRTVMLRDDVEAIATEVRGALARRPALLFTVGGLGPTSDDRTLEGVALGLGVRL
jgi:molybdopterin-biosynthesis enzyme MoeA-like protein